MSKYGDEAGSGDGVTGNEGGAVIFRWCWV
jgi:hypothetical protein